MPRDPKRFEYLEFTTYAHLAPALINGDESGCTKEDFQMIAQVEKFLDAWGFGIGNIVSCSEEAWFSHRPQIGNLAGDVYEYVAMKAKDVGGGVQ